MTKPRDAADSRIRVLLVDDDGLVLEGLRAILATAHDLEVVGQARDGTELAAALARTAPHVALVDIRMPGLDGVSAVRAANEEPGPTRFLMMTAFDDDGRVLDAVAAGASGFVLKDDDPTRIISAVRDVGSGGSAYSPRSAEHLTRWVRSSGDAVARRDAVDRLAQLTDRERELALALVTGASDAELAAQFFIAESTVKATLSSIKTKWGTRNRTQIAVIAARAT